MKGAVLDVVVLGVGGAPVDETVPVCGGDSVTWLPVSAGWTVDGVPTG